MNGAYPLAFAVGIFSALHCAGMCGGIAGALSFSLPAEIRSRAGRLALYLLAFNLGRIASYALAGALFGGVGGALVAADGTRTSLYLALRLLAALTLVAVGLYLAGLLPRFVGVERLGEPLWRRIEPLGRRLLPVRSLPRATLYGAVWGWLPCGLVYSMLIGSPAQVGAGGGAVYMALFGAGTLPVLVGGGLLAGRLYALARDRRFQLAAGLAVACLGLSTLYFQGYNGKI
jgi:sulfite exporter TauE/SafE